MNTQLLSQARQLSVQDQLELVEALWEGIAGQGDVPSPNEAQKAELDRRVSELNSNPNDVIAWSDVKLAALAHIGQ